MSTFVFQISVSSLLIVFFKHSNIVPIEINAKNKSSLLQHISLIIQSHLRLRKKGVLDLETCLDYFQEKVVKIEFEFCHLNSLAIRTEKPVQFAQKFFETLLDFSQQPFKRQMGGNIQIFKTFLQQQFDNQEPNKHLTIVS